MENAREAVNLEDKRSRLDKHLDGRDCNIHGRISSSEGQLVVQGRQGK